jgi:hypothetical protein
MNASVDHVLRQIGLSEQGIRERTVVHLGIENVDDLSVFYDADIDVFAKSLVALPVAQRVTLTALQRIKLKAVCDLCRDLKTRGIPLDEQNVMDRITSDSIVAHLRESKAEADSSTGAAVSAPAKFESARWITWHLKFMNFLRFTMGCAKIPLYYLVRERELNPADIAQLNTPVEQKIYQAPLVGANFARDNRSLWGLLKDKLLDSPAWPWISAYSTSENGRAAMLALRRHYNGNDQTESRISYAQSLIDNASFTDGKVHCWEAFVTQLKSGYEILGENNVIVDNRMKVRTLLDKIVVSNSSLIAVKQNVSMSDNLRNDFDQAVSAISERIVSLFPQSNGSPRKRVSKLTKHNRRQPTDPTPSIIIPKSKNGVDLSNPLRFFTKDEITKLGADLWKDIISLKRSVKGKRRGGRKIQMVTLTDQVSIEAPVQVADALATTPAQQTTPAQPLNLPTGQPPAFGARRG